VSFDYSEGRVTLFLCTSWKGTDIFFFVGVTTPHGHPKLCTPDTVWTSDIQTAYQAHELGHRTGRVQLRKISQHRRQLLVEVRRGAGTCDAPRILGWVLNSAFMQSRARLSCSNSLTCTGLHTFRRHASPQSPRAAAYGGDWTLVRFSKEDFVRSSSQTLPSGPLRVAICPERDSAAATW